jgi:nucleoside-diphosphate-sugar epimerase
MKIYLTGSSGFVGKSVKKYLGDIYQFSELKRGSPILINADIVLHFAGISHDLRDAPDIDSYYEVNTRLTEKVFDCFLSSNANVFIILSSVKAVADEVESDLTEQHRPKPVTHYGKSKLLAEKYIFSNRVPDGKRVYVLRPCLIYGPGNLGNLTLLYNFLSRGIPWPLGAFDNKRSFCSIYNLMFVIQNLIENHHIPSGVYNVADDDPISTNDLIKLISRSKKIKIRVLHLPKFLIFFSAKVGDIFKLSFNSERLKKLTCSYVVNNEKIKRAIGKSLPMTAKDALIKTFESFN